jgi:hypothetical protein
LVTARLAAIRAAEASAIVSARSTSARLLSQHLSDSDINGDSATMAGSATPIG